MFESLQGSGVGYSDAYDLYSLGATFYEMLSGKKPYGEAKEYGDDVLEQARAANLDRVPPRPWKSVDLSNNYLAAP